ncbi:MAG: hypothetical protein KA285_07340 [Bacteroidia bacterium]|nr:hypothetical protein [Bacteroidia bacterium]
MKILITRIAFCYSLFFLFGGLQVKGQSSFCNVQKETIQEVLNSRKGSSVEYSENVTTGIAFLLSTECDTALNYFTAALKVNQTPSLSKLISDMSKGSGVVSTTTPSATAPVTTSPNEKKEVKNTPEPTPNPTSNSTETASLKNERTTSNKNFSEEELGAFQSKGLMKVKKLMDYLEVIAQKSTPQTTANSTIESAVGLFDNENRVVQVTSKSRPGFREFPVRTYLTRLRMMNYEKVVIEAAAFTYVSSFVQGPDGNYYGIARFRQSFTGYRENKPQYNDITTKTVTVVLKPYQKAVEGESIELWDVFLGDIEVAINESKGK